MTGCICEGNWRTIVKEYVPRIGQIFNGRKGETLRFYGLVHADDDYYYGMVEVGTGKCHLLSCVGDIESYYDPVVLAS